MKRRIIMRFFFLLYHRRRRRRKKALSVVLRNFLFWKIRWKMRSWKRKKYLFENAREMAILLRCKFDRKWKKLEIKIEIIFRQNAIFILFSNIFAYVVISLSKFNVAPTWKLNTKNNFKSILLPNPISLNLHFVVH